MGVFKMVHYGPHTRISLEAVLLYVNEMTKKPHIIVREEPTNIRFIVPKNLGVKWVLTGENRKTGEMVVIDHRSQDITKYVEVCCFPYDVDNYGYYSVEGIRNGTLTFKSKRRLTESDIQRLVEIQYRIEGVNFR